jgi:HlyD family secretion protein
LSGYIEGEPLYLASPISAPVAGLSVHRGDRVAAGQALFQVDPRLLQSQRAGAEASVAEAKARSQGARASLERAKAAFEVAASAAREAADTAARYGKLKSQKSGAASDVEIERALTQNTAAAAQARAARADLDAASAALEAAKRDEARAGASLAEAEVRLAYASGHAPASARVEDVFYQNGEWAAANQPLLSLLPDDRVRLRFFVPEREVALYRPGGTVSFTCDACDRTRTARINYVSPRPEYTPPVIYSRKTRDALVFLVEALPEAPQGLTPGQPVDVAPLEAKGR